jgi:hypothetical protein
MSQEETEAKEYEYKLNKVDYIRNTVKPLIFGLEEKV